MNVKRTKLSTTRTLNQVLAISFVVLSTTYGLVSFWITEHLHWNTSIVSSSIGSIRESIQQQSQQQQQQLQPIDSHSTRQLIYSIDRQDDSQEQPHSKQMDRIPAPQSNSLVDQTYNTQSQFQRSDGIPMHQSINSDDQNDKSDLSMLSQLENHKPDTKLLSQPIQQLSCHEVNPHVIGGHDGLNINNNINNNSKSDRPFATPILIMGLPKVGTSTIRRFFKLSGYNTSHWTCFYSDRMSPHVKNLNLRRSYKNKHMPPFTYCGSCLDQAIHGLNLTTPLQDCGNYEVYTQMDVTIPKGNKEYNANTTTSFQRDICHFPQITELETFHKYYPHATFVLNMRNVTNWIHSTTKWASQWGNNQSIATRLAACHNAGGPISSQPNDLQDWYCSHMERVRSFVQKYPSHALVEIDIAHPQAGQRMASIFHSKPEHWKHFNQGNSSVYQN